jgi:hypothetical protein
LALQKSRHNLNRDKVRLASNGPKYPNGFFCPFNAFSPAHSTQCSLTSNTSAWPCSIDLEAATALYTTLALARFSYKKEHVASQPWTRFFSGRQLQD